jgi:hypothetical protein
MTGILNALLGFLKPAGGPFTVIQTFTSSTSWVAPEGVTEVEWLIVAGGGGGGSLLGGGGGSGGYRTATGLAVTAGTTYTITVGGGGAGAVATGPGDVAGTSGGFSSIAGAPITENPSGAGTNTLKAYGGGGGGSNNATVDGENGRGRSGRRRRLWHCHPQVRSNPGHDC